MQRQEILTMLQREYAALRQEADKIQKVIGILRDDEPVETPSAGRILNAAGKVLIGVASAKRDLENGTNRISRAGRRRIAAAQKKRWSKYRKAHAR